MQALIPLNSFIAFFAEAPNLSCTIVCVRAQRKHSDLSGCVPKRGALAGWLLGNKAPTSGVLDTRGYNTDHHPTDRHLPCKLSGY